jgi:hypothetical protein
VLPQSCCLSVYAFCLSVRVRHATDAGCPAATAGRAAWPSVRLCSFLSVTLLSVRLSDVSLVLEGQLYQPAARRLPFGGVDGNAYLKHLLLRRGVAVDVPGNLAELKEQCARVLESGDEPPAASVGTDGTGGRKRWMDGQTDRRTDQTLGHSELERWQGKETGGAEESGCADARDWDWQHGAWVTGRFWWQLKSGGGRLADGRTDRHCDAVVKERVSWKTLGLDGWVVDSWVMTWQTHERCSIQPVIASISSDPGE